MIKPREGLVLLFQSFFSYLKSHSVVFVNAVFARVVKPVFRFPLLCLNQYTSHKTQQST
jgi:hypothetical protein